MSDLVKRYISHTHAPCPGCVELEELLKADIARLRAEVERLQTSHNSMTVDCQTQGCRERRVFLPQIETLEQERNEALAEIRDHDESRQLAIEGRLEALAQVATLLEFCRGAMLDTSSLPISARARALLDSIHTLQDIVEAMPDTPGRPERLLDRLEASVSDAREILARWKGEPDA